MHQQLLAHESTSVSPDGVTQFQAPADMGQSRASNVQINLIYTGTRRPDLVVDGVNITHIPMVQPGPVDDDPGERHSVAVYETCPAQNLRLSAAIGPTTAAAMAAHDVVADVVADPPDKDQMIRQIVAAERPPKIGQ